ncbi:aspartate kinase [Sungkyunkwania multivorans]|uniref:Homoserine dehydrogenase n=1 Tax=Sungkyunkwania multivorans TaxID=1173618 RepID=A0ABW3CYA7_9FLAO
MKYSESKDVMTPSGNRGPKTINIVLFGIGNVGGTLIKQIEEAQPRFLAKGLQIHIPVIANSNTAFFAKPNAEKGWEAGFKSFGFPQFIQDIFKFVKENELKNLIAVDATASADLVGEYFSLIENGFHIVSANKIANTLDVAFYTKLRDTLKKHHRRFLYETNVGAGLPVIETIKNLHDSGERITRIRGVFSGSLSYIFNRFSAEEKSFADILKEASENGYTEPDAREDLSGNDVARKLLILARELDLKREFEDVKVDSLIPTQLNGKTSVNEFKRRIDELNPTFENKKNQQAKGHVLRYVGELSVTEERLDVKLVSTPADSPLGQLKGADSLIEIYSDSYKKQPLVIQGAGAGKEVTARGVLGDIVKLAENLI